MPRPPSPRTIPSWLFSQGAGVQLSGDSGSGKSNALEVILHRLAQVPRTGLLFIDPHGTSAKKLRRMLLARGPSMARRIVYIHPAGIEDTTNRLPTINPLHVPGDPRSIRWLARLGVVVDANAKILLSAFGESDFDAKPVLFKNTTRILTTLAYAGLPLADAKLLLDLHSPIYRPLVKVCPDLLMQAQMAELPDLRAADRQAQLESTSNRFFALLSNPIFEAMTSRTDGALNFADLYADRAIVIVDLEAGGVLRPMDQQILANLFLTGMVFELLNAPEAARYPYFVALDELPVFQSSFSLLTWLATQTRKYLCRFILAHQGIGGFPERADDPLLHALSSQMRTKLIFRHGSVADCDYFGGLLALPDYDPRRVKHVQRTPQQFQVGHRLVVLEDESEGTNDVVGSSDATGTTAATTTTVTETANSAEARTFRELVEESRNESRGTARATGRSEATGTTTTATQNRSHGTTTSRTRKQQLVPVLETRHIISSVQFLTREEQAAMTGTALTRLETGSAFLYVTGSSPTLIHLPLAVDPFARTPKYGRKKQLEQLRQQELHPAFATLAQIDAEHQAQIEALVGTVYAHLDAGGFTKAEPLLAAKPRVLTPGVSITVIPPPKPGPADAF